MQTGRKGDCYWRLVFSSSFFLIPAIYAYTLRLYYLAFTSVMTTFISVNFWRRADPHSWRKTMDVVFARFSFSVFFLSGCFFIKNSSLFVTGWMVGILIVCFYMLSMNAGSHWIYFHMLFHLSVALGQSIVVVGS